MPKKKKKTAKKKVKKVKKAKKKKVAKKAPRLGAKRIARDKAKAKAKEKPIGLVEHYFGKISVAALKLKAPLKVGDMIHIKGHTTDFTQRVDSIQIEHQNVTSAKKGQDVGFKVKAKVREHDFVYLAPKEKGITAQPATIQQPMFPAKITKQIPPPKAQKGYEGKKFFSF